MKKNEYFFVYETTNLVNNMKYRGMHKTNNIHDNYIGSGTIFTNAVKKYGKENFKREILEFCNSYNELIELEKKYVNEEWVKNRNNYNVKTGGQSSGVLSQESKNKISKKLKEKYDSGELIAKGGEKRKGEDSWNKGLQMSDEFKEKCSNSGKKRYQEDENHPFKLHGNKNGHHKGETISPMSNDIKNKISESLKKKWKEQDHPTKGLEPWNKNKKGLQVAWNKGKEMEKIECPHCGKLSDKLNAKKWHFDNCKFKKSDT